MPTIAEAGFPGFEDDSWVGLWVHVGTPTAVITRLREEMARIAGLPDTRERLRQIQPGQFELRLNHQVSMTDLSPQYPAMGEAFMVDGDGRLCSRMSLG